MITDQNKFDIAIVGAGLVGSIAALLLANHGFKILLLDINKEPECKFSISSVPPDLRMSAITLKSQEILEQLGVWQEAQNRLGLMQKVYAWEEQGPASVSLDSHLIGKNYLASIIENNYLLEIVNNKIKQNNSICIERPVRIKNIYFNKKNNSSNLELDDNSNLYSVDLIIGADGANSWLRNYFGFQYDSEPYNHFALVTNITTEIPHQNIAYQKFLKQGPLALLPWMESNSCSIVWSQSEYQARKMQSCSESEFNQYLEQAIDSKLGKVLKSDTRVVFPLIKRHVDNYYQSGVVLVGDAAHTIHPLAGQGLNLGIYDVYELVNILALAKSKNSSINSNVTLKKYQLVRKGHNQQFLSLMSLFKNFYDSEQQNNKPLSLVRNIGVTLVDNISFVKKQITKFAAGYY